MLSVIPLTASVAPFSASSSVGEVEGLLVSDVGDEVGLYDGSLDGNPVGKPEGFDEGL